MIAVVGFWENNELNVNSGLDFYLDMWRECVKPFGVVDLALVDVDGLSPICGDLEMNFVCEPTLDEVLAHYPEARQVYLEAALKCKAAGLECQSLPDFTHPVEPVIYIAGPDSAGLNLEHMKEEGAFEHADLVTVPTVNSFALWSLEALAIVLYDRHRRSG